jgi:hypothetical protein
LSIGEYIAPAWRERLAAAGLARPAELLDHSPLELALAGKWNAWRNRAWGGANAGAGSCRTAPVRNCCI